MTQNPPDRLRLAIRNVMGSSDGGSPELLADIIALHIGFLAYARWLNENSRKLGGPYAKQMLQLLPRFQGAVDGFMQGSLREMVERQDATRLKAPYRKANTGARLTLIRRRAEFFLTLLQFLRSRQPLLQELFPTGRSVQHARKLANFAEETDPAAILSNLARLPSVSGNPRFRSWLRGVAGEVGIEVSSGEALEADTATVHAIADQMEKVAARQGAADPMSEKALEAASDQEALRGAVEEVAAASPDPSAVRATVATRRAQRTLPKVAQEMGLNDEQAEFLMSSGNVVLAAGAGSGKTHTLTATVKHHVVDRGVPPERILVTTFTRSAMTEMKERIEGMGVHNAEIGTTHTISRQIISRYNPSLKKALQGATDGTADRLFRMAVVQVGLHKTQGHDGGGGRPWRRRRWAAGQGGPTPYWKKAIGDWFNLGQEPQDSRGKKIGEKRLKTVVGMFKNASLSVEAAWQKHEDDEYGDPLRYYAAAVYGAYEWLKKEDPQGSPCLDFDDWLVEAVKIVENNPQAAKQLQDWFRVVIVDEAQDLNALQHRLFSVIGQGSDLFAFIGDDKQAIYEFRGAVPEEFVGKSKAGEFQTKLLTRNYRSGGNIVESANKLIAHNGDRQIPMVCRAREGREGEGTLEARMPPDHQAAAKEATIEIEAAIQGGASPDDFGVLVRNGAEAEAYCMSLAARGIPFRSKSAGRFFQKPAVKSLTAWMRLAQGQPTDRNLNGVVVEASRVPGFFLGKTFADRMSAASRKQRMAFLDLLLNGNTAIYGRANHDRNVQMLATTIAAFRRDTDGADTNTIIREILALRGSSGKTFMDFLKESVNPADLGEDEIAGIEPTDEEIEIAAKVQIKPLLDLAAVPRFNDDPAQYIGFLDVMSSRMSQASRKGKDQDPVPAVRVDTCHQWKGLEAKHVYVSMAGGTFPNFRADQAYDAGDETAYDSERRLAYVAITRGKESVTIMCPRENYLGKEGGLSRFVSEACIPIAGQEPEGDPSDEAARTAFQQDIEDEEAEMGWADLDYEEPLDPSDLYVGSY